VAGAVVFIPVLLAGLGIGIGGLGIVPLAYPASIAPWVIYAWVAAGLLVLGYYYLRHRERIGMTRMLFTDASPEAAAPTAGPDAGAHQARWIRSSSLAVK
jgi:hypothetical protein